MNNSKWPALLIQSFILTFNVAFLLESDNPSFFIISLSIILFLFILQAFPGNQYFLYLLPASFPKEAKKLSWKTWYLRVSIILAILFFYLGSTEFLFHQFLR
jgi:hypothetical protein